jgi:hypothetical protein
MKRPRYQTFAQLARRLPGRTGNGVHPSTLWRWHRAGLDTPNGRVHLRAVKAGGVWCSTWPWLNQFFQQLTAGPAPEIESAPQRNRRLEQMEKALDAMGI